MIGNPKRATRLTSDNLIEGNEKKLIDASKADSINDAPTTTVLSRIIYEYEADRDINLPEGTEMYCKDTGIKYVLIGGNFVALNIYVGTSAPPNPTTNMLWVDIS